MKKSIIAALSLILLGTAAFAQTDATVRTRTKVHTRHQHTGTVSDKQTKRNMNRGGHMNNGDNGDKNNDRGRGDKNNRQVK